MTSVTSEAGTSVVEGLAVSVSDISGVSGAVEEELAVTGAAGKEDEVVGARERKVVGGMMETGKFMMGSWVRMLAALLFFVLFCD